MAPTPLHVLRISGVAHSTDWVAHTDASGGLVATSTLASRSGSGAETPKI
jgi:hypothetical protein